MTRAKDWPRRLAERLNVSVRGALTNGLASLALSLWMWKLTGSLVGWLVLFLPGAAMIFWGWVLILRDE